MTEKSTFFNIIRTVVAVLFISVFAQITINIPSQTGDIPITGQTFAVLLVGYFLHRKFGTLAVVLYAILGAFGLPIFADGESGFEVMLGGSGGFILGFIAGAYLLGWFGELGWSKHFPKSLIAMTLGTLIIIAFGVARLTYLYDFERALEWGFYPFIVGGIVKIVLGAAVLPIYNQLKNSKM